MTNSKFFLCTFKYQDRRRGIIKEATFICDMFSEGDVAILYKRLIAIADQTIERIHEVRALHNALKEFIIEMIPADDRTKAQLSENLTIKESIVQRAQVSSTPSHPPIEVELVLVLRRKTNIRHHAPMLSEQFEKYQRMIEPDYKASPNLQFMSKIFEEYSLMVVDGTSDNTETPIPMPMILVWKIDGYQSHHANQHVHHYSALEKRVNNYISRRVDYEKGFFGNVLDEVDQLFVSNFDFKRPLNRRPCDFPEPIKYEPVIEYMYDPRDWGSVTAPYPDVSSWKYRVDDTYYKRVAEYLRSQYLRYIAETHKGDGDLMKELTEVNSWKYLNYLRDDSGYQGEAEALEVVFMREPNRVTQTADGVVL